MKNRFHYIKVQGLDKNNIYYMILDRLTEDDPKPFVELYALTDQIGKARMLCKALNEWEIKYGT